MSDFQHVRLNRDLVAEDNHEPVQFRGEWSPDESVEGWELFTVMLHGDEAGDLATATIGDLRAILDALAESSKGVE